MLKIGLIGCGGIGVMHAECWLMLMEELKDVKLVAIAEPNVARAQKYADNYGVKLYTDGNEMLEKEELDVVDICLPTFLHARYLCKAMQHVHNVIVEKPLCLHEEEAQQILDTEKATGALVQVAHVMRYEAPTRYIKELIDSGKYGKVITANLPRLSPRPTWMRGHDDINVSGTVVLDLHIHDVDYVLYIMGREPDDVKVWAIKDENGVVQHLKTCYVYGDQYVSSEASWDYPASFPFTCPLRVRLEKAAVTMESSGKVTVYPFEGDAFSPEMPAPITKDIGINMSDMRPYIDELRDFVQVIRSGSNKGAVTLAEAAAAFRLARKELELALEG
ncbi:MAG: Gfo/Idh/MocA family oxidoreductase [Firmicutes bacterium]|nr:Gfo/Idh/MocA family oxidoreductase [Bacillota bacterium]